MKNLYCIEKKINSKQVVYLKKIEPAKKRSLPVVVWTPRIGESVNYPLRGEAEMSMAALLNLVKTYGVNSFSIQARDVTEGIPKAS